jgi:hypothetical protein
MSKADWDPGGKVGHGSRKSAVSAIVVVLVLTSGIPLLAQSGHLLISPTHGSELSLGGSLIRPATLDASGGDLPNAPSSGEATVPANPPAPVSRQSWIGASPAAKGAEFGFEGRVADRNYWISTGAMFAASIANVEATHDCLADSQCIWVPDMFRRRRNMLMVGIPADLGVAYLSYYMKKKHSRIWSLPEGLVTGANALVCIHDARRAME